LLRGIQHLPLATDFPTANAIQVTVCLVWASTPQPSS
jgi:hypothetical protein